MSGGHLHHPCCSTCTYHIQGRYKLRTRTLLVYARRIGEERGLPRQSWKWGKWERGGGSSDTPPSSRYYLSWGVEGRACLPCRLDLWWSPKEQQTNCNCFGGAKPKNSSTTVHVGFIPCAHNSSYCPRDLQKKTIQLTDVQCTVH